MSHEKINKIVLVLILILALIQFFSGVFIINPNDTTLDRTPKFSWYGGYDEYKLLVDNNPKFTSPVIEVVTNNHEYVPNEKLDPGYYYWKVIGYSSNKEINSITGSFNLKSYVGYSLNENNLINVGNVISSLNGPTGAVVFDVGENMEIDGGEYYIEQNE